MVICGRPYGFIHLILCAQLNNRLAKIQFCINVPHRRQLHTFVWSNLNFPKARMNRIVSTISYCLDWNIIVYSCTVSVVVCKWKDSREARKRQSTLTHSGMHPNGMTLCFAYCSFDNTTQNKYRRMNAQVSNCEQKCQNQSNHFTHHALAFHHSPNEIYTRDVSNATTDVISLVKTTILSRTPNALPTCRRTISKKKTK